MIYLELYLSDYAEATAHLSFVEDAAYLRLLRKYYAAEGPIPADLKAAQRLIGARTREEREAVETVLGEFFTLQPDGWHNARADEAIAKYHEKRAKAARSANARWAPMRTHGPEDANASPPPPADAMRTHCEGNALQHQHQHQPSVGNITPASEIPAAATAAGRACRLMRDAGCSGMNPSHPTLIEALAAGVTPEALGDTAREAVDAGKAKPFAWACTTALSRHQERHRHPATGAPRHAQPDPRGDGRRESLVERQQRLLAEHANAGHFDDDRPAVA